MEKRGEPSNSSQSPQLVYTRGNPVTGRHREKTERVQEALSDLQLAIGGCVTQLSQPSKPDVFRQSVASFARSSSIFLRKLTIGDRNERSTRLLDDDVCSSIGLSFHRVQKIRSTRTPMDIAVAVSGGYMELTKLDDRTLAPEKTYRVPIGPQGFKLSVEWPLPGMADWINRPTREEPWQIKPTALFDTTSAPSLNCDNWLGQQLVMFDNTGISLREIIRTTTNTEGAHSADVAGRSGTDNAIVNGQTQILSNMKMFGLQYNHIIVIESALYLYERLIHSEGIQRPKGEIDMPTFCLVLDSADDVLLNYNKWLAFDGGLTISLGGGGQSISHKIRATR